MDYKEFVESVKEKLEGILGNEYRVCLDTVVKNNRKPTDTMAILKKGENASPVIYLEPYYEKFVLGASLMEIVLHILDFYKENRVSTVIDVEFLKDFSKVRGNIICKLVNCRKNCLMLESMPHRHFLDLVLIYYINMEHALLGNGGVRIQNTHLDLWGISEKELFKAAEENMEKYMSHRFVRLPELLEEMTGVSLDAEPELFEDSPMYVLTNEKRCFGAAVITLPHVLRSVARELQDDFFVLPSSIHECMILPVHCTDGKNSQQLRGMVCEINHAHVAKDEILGDSVYRYVAADEMLYIAADAESDGSVEAERY